MARITASVRLLLLLIFCAALSCAALSCAVPSHAVPRLQNLQGNWALKQGKIQEAVLKFTSAMESVGETEKNTSLKNWLSYNLGAAYYLLGETDNALNQWNLVGEPASALLGYYRNYNRGILLFHKGDYAGAEGEFRKALRVNPKDMDAKVNLEIAIRNRRAASEKMARETFPQDPSEAVPEQPLSQESVDNILSRIQTLSTLRQGIPEQRPESPALRDW